MNKIWKGRIQKDTAGAVEDFTYSIDIDRSLYLHDLTGTAAHVIGLKKIGIINDPELKKILVGLLEIKQKIESGSIDIGKHEDIHSLVENELYSLIGDPALKIHTGRSRNDQVVLDEKLFCKDIIISLLSGMIGLLDNILKLSEKNTGTVFPAYTHMQKAQPVLLTHYLLSYFDKFYRDCKRLVQDFENCDYMPLGAAACAGSGYELDRNRIAGILKFKNLATNSMDIVGSRDFIIDLVYSCSMIMIHLSRFCEDLIIYNSDEFSYIEIEESYCTGSSIMPQKKNPDIMELVRGKSSLVIGNLIQIMILLKALPSTYNRDLQEDKKVLFNAVGDTTVSVDIFRKLLLKIKFNKDIISDKLKQGFLEATDMADYLVKKGESFRNAHHIIGGIVKYCIENNKNIPDLSIDELKGFSGLFENDIFSKITMEACCNAKNIDCGTSSKQVTAKISQARSGIKELLSLLEGLKERTVDLQTVVDSDIDQ
ncbi:MAG: argininosuccinate lyase [Actinobacteria bacterium]|nr:argininosuccinate lyase [Actinomycetota bacterium]